ncbi:MAG: 4Fe-4S binding protein [Candidatus Methanomethylophilaceae archaeon]|nr:4Fe-4S binding protein [Candidatus Methanomethylophilaceae archaeon]
MNRNIVRIDRERCIGCGRCVEACAEGAIEMVDGKATLAKESMCDGLGACLPACPADAISIESVEEPLPSIPMANGTSSIADGSAQWPLQLRLSPASAPFLRGSDFLLAADCSAFANRSFHETFADGKTIVIGCPKLDPKDSWDKLSEMISFNDVRSVTVIRMEVPCCSPLERATSAAVTASGKRIPLRVVVLEKDGSIKSDVSS